MVATKHPVARPRPPADVASDASPCGDRQAPRTVAPNLWMGECDCLIGPFSCRRVAESFANAMVDFGHYECVYEQVVERQGAYFVEAVGVGESVVLDA